MLNVAAYVLVIISVGGGPGVVTQVDNISTKATCLNIGHAIIDDLPDIRGAYYVSRCFDKEDTPPSPQ